jgi:hypothetical protein
MTERDKYKNTTGENIMGKVQFHYLTDGRETKGWVHTHGMDCFGLPELEMRDIPGFLVEDAARMLKAVCDYMLDSGNKVCVGETMALSDRTVFRFVMSVPIPGEEEHYEVERWQIVEVEHRCEECGLKSLDRN